MANTIPTSIKFFRAIQLCLLLLFAPTKFEAEEKAYNLELNSVSDKANPNCSSSSIVRHAFFYSALVVAVSGSVGYLFGLILGVFSCATPKLIAWFQVVGACLLLWGTLFVRGWEIQSYGGINLTERINQWLYRSLYCVGTAILICSLAWPQCSG
jgi:hypothetical protein